MHYGHDYDGYGARWAANVVLTLMSTMAWDDGGNCIGITMSVNPAPSPPSTCCDTSPVKLTFGVPVLNVQHGLLRLGCVFTVVAGTDLALAWDQVAVRAVPGGRPV